MYAWTIKYLSVRPCISIGDRPIGCLTYEKHSMIGLSWWPPTIYVTAEVPSKRRKVITSRHCVKAFIT